MAAAQINHPHAVALYDRGVHEDALFLIMEKVEGATLAEHIRDEGQSPVIQTSSLDFCLDHWTPCLDPCTASAGVAESAASRALVRAHI
ncbi:hypothetical protein [Streptomyces agglomeratus]|uniref:hypothetical protein n=1 Tax=Streptomyces agglomeratus TaxID=285458 RepID=UPI001428BA1A|nr:hypothetical protein [Streptomyces agglomeratus]